MRNKIIETAEKYVGYLEKKSNKNLYSMTANAGNMNYTRFAVTYKELTGEDYQGQAWCAMFISAIFSEAFGVTQGEKLLNGFFSYCPYGVIQFERACQFSKTPEPGSIIFFKDSKGVACHVGIVYKVDNTYVYTIEGNTSSANGVVVANGGAVAKKKYIKTYSKIMGYGNPKYINYTEEKEMEEKIYNWTSACPEWSQPYVHKALELGIIKGDENGNLNLTDTKIWCLVVIMRATGIMK